MTVGGGLGYVYKEMENVQLKVSNYRKHITNVNVWIFKKYKSNFV